MKLLLDYKTDIDKQDKDGNTALIIAIGRHDETITKLLLEEDADVDKTNIDGYTPLLIGKIIPKYPLNNQEVLINYSDRKRMCRKWYNY